MAPTEILARQHYPHVEKFAGQQPSPDRIVDR